MRHHAKRLAALSLLVMLSGCAFDQLWRSEAQKECNRSNSPGPDRLDCYQRAEAAKRQHDAQ
jgi:hypothetical protein